VTFGLQLWNAAGTLGFDSTAADGGVCLGIYAVAATGQTISFPDIIGATGVAIATGMGGALNYTTDSVPGYLRFVFPAIGIAQHVALFAK
jgi:hypothetical protein